MSLKNNIKWYGPFLEKRVEVCDDTNLPEIHKLSSLREKLNVYYGCQGSSEKAKFIETDSGSNSFLIPLFT